MGLPANISYGTVVGQYIASLADSSDVDKLPEGVPMTGTITFQYDEVRLARWSERKVEEAGILSLLCAVLTDVGFDIRRERSSRGSIPVTEHSLARRR